MTKKNDTTSYAPSTLNYIKQKLVEQIIPFAVGCIVAIGTAYLTVLSDHSRLVAVEIDKADKSDIQVLESKIDNLSENQKVLMQYFKLVPKEQNEEKVN